MSGMSHGKRDLTSVTKGIGLAQRYAIIVIQIITITSSAEIIDEVFV
jgi:hypothetical protein